MRLLLRFCCYLAIFAFVAAGAMGGLIALTSDDGQRPAAETRKPAANRITMWQERKAEEELYAAKEAAAKEAAAKEAAAKEAANKEATARAFAARSTPVTRPIEGRAQPAVVAIRTKPKKQIDKRSPQTDEVALGYASAPPSRIAYENVFNAMRDRAGN
jgi:hypothetical protein